MSGTTRQDGRPTPDVGGFVDVACEAFHFLEPDLLPHVVCDTPELAVVRYSGGDTAVEVIHDRLRGGELYVVITRRIAGHDALAVERESLNDVVAVDHDLASVGVRTFMVRPDDTPLLRRCLGQQAQWTRQYATPVIAGDVAWFRRRDRQRDPNAPGNRIGRARRAARIAWREQDHRTVIASYETLSDAELQALPPLDQARLRYARKVADNEHRPS